MKKTSFISALSIGVLSISMAFASPADAVNQVRENSVQVLKILNSGDANTARQKAEAYAIPYFDFQTHDSFGRRTTHGVLQLTHKNKR